MLGAFLGLAYLSKAIMFPAAFIFLAGTLAVGGAWRRNVRAVLVATVAFTVTAAPFVVALSMQKGRATFGDAGKVNHEWFVNGVAKYAHWQGEPPGRGTPAHPDRKVHAQPDVFEYATPVSGTLPTWYDPTYWHEGIETFVTARGQAAAITDAAHTYASLLTLAGSAVLALGALLAMSSGAELRRRLTDSAVLVVPALTPFGAYAIGARVELRFVGAFAAVILLAVLPALRLPKTREMRNTANALLVGAALLLAAQVAVRTLGYLAAGSTSRNPDAEIAEAMTRVGVERGDQVGVLGYPYDMYWARLAHVRIIADLPPTGLSQFWSGTDSTRHAVYAAFSRAGVRVLVSEQVPMTASARGWRPVLRDGPWVYFLDDRSAGTPSHGILRP